MSNIDLTNIKITPVDSTAANDGAWTNYRGVDLRIARANNDNFKKTFMRLARPYRKDIAQDNLDEKISESIMCEAIADAVLVDWKNFSINGTEVPYSRANAIALLKNDADCRKFVQDFSADLSNYISRDKEEVVAKS